LKNIQFREGDFSGEREDPVHPEIEHSVIFTDIQPFEWSSASDGTLSI
jgi:hypothetical protein